MKSLRQINLILKSGGNKMGQRQDNRGKMQTIVRKLILHKGKLCAEPDFGKERIKLYPIPDSLQDTAKSRYQVGENIQGKVGRLWHTKKKDGSGNGKPIYIQYFVPTEFLGDVV